MTNGVSPPRRRVVVVGGGVSGLVAAHTLADTFDVVLLEASRTTGGLVRTREFRGRSIDAAADVFITRSPDAEKLAWSLGLGADLIPPATNVASVFARGAVRPLPRGLVLGVPTDLGALWNSGVVSRRSVLRATADLVGVGSSPAGRPDTQDTDPTIAEAFEPHFGREVITNLIDPLLGGINAGDARALSLAATAPMLADATAGKTSVIRALRPLARRDRRDGASPMFLGFAEGMSTLTERLAHECARRGVTIRTSTSARSLRAIESGSVRVETASDTVVADGALVALPAWAAAPLIRPLATTLADELEAIPYASVATITLSYALEDASSRPPLSGSGVLIPRGDALSTALTFVSTKWPRRMPNEEFFIRASVGRQGDRRAFELDDAELTRRVHAEIARMLSIAKSPTASHVERFPDAFPQYVSGHLARRDRIRQLAVGLGPIVVTGSWLAGIGIPSCIAAAQAAARELAERLR